MFSKAGFGYSGFHFSGSNADASCPPPQGGSARFRVSIDGQPPGSTHGVDIDAGGNGTVTEQRLYQLIRQMSPIVDRQFEIEFLEAGVETFAFTFG